MGICLPVPTSRFYLLLNTKLDFIKSFAVITKIAQYAYLSINNSLKYKVALKIKEIFVGILHGLTHIGRR